MTSIYPKLPGYSIYHNPTQTDFKKISSTMLETIRGGDQRVNKGSLPIPRQWDKKDVQTRTERSKSSSQTTLVNHFGSEINELFQPDWVKMEKQVLRFFGYVKESIVEIAKETARVRMLRVFYYLIDDILEIVEKRKSNSGIFQGPFLKRGKVS